MFTILLLSWGQYSTIKTLLYTKNVDDLFVLTLCESLMNIKLSTISLVTTGNDVNPQ